MQVSRGPDTCLAQLTIKKNKVSYFDQMADTHFSPHCLVYVHMTSEVAQVLLKHLVSKNTKSSFAHPCSLKLMLTFISSYPHLKKKNLFYLFLFNQIFSNLSIHTHSQNADRGMPKSYCSVVHPVLPSSAHPQHQEGPSTIDVSWISKQPCQKKL